MLNQTIGSVNSTKDYGKFKSIKGNRGLNLLHLGRLRRSVEIKQLVIPIIVNEKFEIIDGQHRFEVFKELDLPIYYIQIEGYGLKECQKLNAVSKAWSPEDYLNGYVDLGSEEYIKVKEFSNKYRFLTIKMCQILLVGGQKDTQYAQTFKEGTFKVRDYENACKIADMMQDFSNYKPFTDSTFHLSLVTVLTNKNYNHERMLQKLSYQNSRLGKEIRVTDYLNTLTEIYNYRTNDKEKVYFYRTK